MYPYELFLGFDMYSLLIAVGVIGCFVMIRLMCDKLKYEAKFQNFVIITTLLTVFGGYGTAVLTQAFYNIVKSRCRFIRSDLYYILLALSYILHREADSAHLVLAKTNNCHNIT